MLLFLYCHFIIIPLLSLYESNNRTQSHLFSFTLPKKNSPDRSIYLDTPHFFSPRSIHYRTAPYCGFEIDNLTYLCMLLSFSCQISNFLTENNIFSFLPLMEYDLRLICNLKMFKCCRIIVFCTSSVVRSIHGTAITAFTLGIFASNIYRICPIRIEIIHGSLNID